MSSGVRARTTSPCWSTLRKSPVCLAALRRVLAIRTRTGTSHCPSPCRRRTSSPACAASAGRSGWPGRAYSSRRAAQTHISPPDCRWKGPGECARTGRPPPDAAPLTSRASCGKGTGDGGGGGGVAGRARRDGRFRHGHAHRRHQQARIVRLGGARAGRQGRSVETRQGPGSARRGSDNGRRGWPASPQHRPERVRDLGVDPVRRRADRPACACKSARPGPRRGRGAGRKACDRGCSPASRCRCGCRPRAVPRLLGGEVIDGADRGAVARDAEVLVANGAGHAQVGQLNAQLAALARRRKFEGLMSRCVIPWLKA